MTAYTTRSPEPRFWWIAIVAPVLLVLTYLFFVRTTVGQQFDDIAFDGRAVEDPEVTRIANELLHVVTRSTLILLTAAIVLVALARRRIRLAIAVGAAITGSAVTTELLKHFLERPQLDGATASRSTASRADTRPSGWRCRSAS